MDLEIVGRHALLFDDDTMAAYVNSAETLVPWAADPTLLLDRFDARHLLDRVPARPPPRNAHSLSSKLAEDDEIDRERYLDLPPGHDASDLAAEDNGSGAASQNTYSAVPFLYGSTGGSTEPGSSDLYHPPFTLPESLSNNLPSSEKVHQIIARTALFVSKHGGQSEIVLRVKQGSNPTFAFLMPEDRLHGYFRYLVDNPELLEASTDTSESNIEKSSGGALSLLGEVYGSGEDDEDHPQSSEGTRSTGNAASAHLNQEKEAFSNIAPTDKDENIEPPVASSLKDKSARIRKNQTLTRPFDGPTKEKTKDSFLALPAISEKVQKRSSNRTESNEVIVEPPSLVKVMMEKIIEFVLRNGKEFEAVLIEQDKNIGRFPFLLQSNQYNPYYQKLLRNATEPKNKAKSSSEKKDGIYSSKDDRRPHSSMSKDSASDRRSAELSEKWVYDHRSKQKFKMEFSLRKDDDHVASSKKSGVSANELAAIVQAATRGASPFNAPQDSTNAVQRAGHTSVDPGPASSNGIFSYQRGVTASSKPLLSNETSMNLSDSRDVSKSTVDDDWIAQTIAKTAALVASREADSSEASMTKEQKLKAERLRRAKMFAEVIKNSGNQDKTAIPFNSLQSGTNGAPTPSTGHVTLDSNTLTKERDSRSAPGAKEMPSARMDGRSHGNDFEESSVVIIDGEASAEEKRKKHSYPDSISERYYRKKETVAYDDGDDQRNDRKRELKHLRKIYKEETAHQTEDDGLLRRHSSSGRKTRHHHRHKHHSSHHQSSSENDSEHASSDDERRHKKARSHHRHRDHEPLSEDEDFGRPHKHSRHHRSSSRRGGEAGDE